MFAAKRWWEIRTFDKAMCSIVLIQYILSHCFDNHEWLWNKQRKDMLISDAKMALCVLSNRLIKMMLIHFVAIGFPKKSASITSCCPMVWSFQNRLCWNKQRKELEKNVLGNAFCVSYPIRTIARSVHDFEIKIYYVDTY